MKPKKREEFDIIRVKADIHPDGDVYIKHKRAYYRIGQLEDDEKNHWSGYIPNPAYKKAKAILNK